jgi:hypothetical protein
MLPVFIGHGAPADVERSFPLLTTVGEQAAAGANAGIVEQEMDLVGCPLLGDFIAKTLELILDRKIRDMGRHTLTLLVFFRLAQSLGLRHRVFRHIA